jgi:hypothetical protein
MADSVYSMTKNEKFSTETLGNIATAAVESYSPLGGTDLGQAITPSMMQIPVDIMRNQKWTGAPIKPQGNKYTPESERYFSSLADTQKGKFMIGVSKELAGNGIEFSPADLNYAVDSLTGGMGRFLDKTATTVESVAKGEMPRARDVPFVSKVMRTSTSEELAQRKSDDPVFTESMTEQERTKLQRGHKIDAALKSLEEAQTREDKLAVLKGLTPDEIESLREAKKRPIGEAAKIKQLNVKDESRAKYIHTKITTLEPDEREAFVKELKQHPELITPDVADQLRALRNGPTTKLRSSLQGK